MYYLAIDFGSTYTKLTAIDIENKKVLGTSRAFTTIETDIREGLDNGLKELEKQIGHVIFDKKICCSSAGGGLKMIALGLVPDLTSKAAKMAASSAGAKVMNTYAYDITQQEQNEIYNYDPDLVLLCGGTDGGNKETIIHNARFLAEVDGDFSIIVAGNKSANYEIEEILKKSGKSYIITKNVMPTFNKLQIEPAKKAIRQLFIEKIIEAKGLSKAQELMHNKIIPTPLAVMRGCELLSKGTQKTEGIGEFLAVDIGGATTDVYSMAAGTPTIPSTIEKGIKEPFSKRTVEGDLGLRYSMESLLQEVDAEILSEEIGIETEIITDWVSRCKNNPDLISDKDTSYKKIDESLAQYALEIAIERHCGTIEKTYTHFGEVNVLTGKDLSKVPYIIGLGGPIVNSVDPLAILAKAKFDPSKFSYMKPQEPEYLLDKNYIFSAMGLLSEIDAETALSIMKDSINYEIK